MTHHGCFKIYQTILTTYEIIIFVNHVINTNIEFVYSIQECRIIYHFYFKTDKRVLKVFMVSVKIFPIFLTISCNYVGASSNVSIIFQ